LFGSEGDMTDELRQVFEDWDSGKHRDIAIFIEAARAHLGCSTITVEEVEAVVDALWDHGYSISDVEARAALEAARVVHREET
jgi:hypothetical protein